MEKGWRNMLLQGKIAIVTGAGRGIGRAIALGLAQQGANIAVADVNPENARESVAVIEHIGRKAVAVAVDVADEEQIAAMVQQCVKIFGKVDILVNNAGIVSTGALTALTSTEWDKVMQINLKSVFLCCREIFPIMTAQRSGKIINIASVAGKRGGGLLGTSCYAASKGGVIAFTKSVAREGGQYGINVNAICPSYTETEMTSSLTPEQRKTIVGMTPLGRPGRPEDIAGAVCFLASSQADFITGEIINVDGGLLMD